MQARLDYRAVKRKYFRGRKKVYRESRFLSNMPELINIHNELSSPTMTSSNSRIVTMRI